MHFSKTPKRFLKKGIRENVMGAENQQERLDEQWIVGFVDGEGCFYVGINYPRNHRQVLPEFRVVQHQDDESLLNKIKNFFACGSVTKNHGDRKEVRVRGMKNLNNIVKFFQTHQLKSRKKKDFEIFANIIDMMNDKKHLSDEGFRKIAELAGQMNRQKQRHQESSETIRQTSQQVMKIESDPISDDRSSSEMVRRQEGLVSNL